MIRLEIIKFLKRSPYLLQFIWTICGFICSVLAKFCPKKKKQILFCSYGGRKFDDSPLAIYKEILKRDEFKDWSFVWVFVNPNNFVIPSVKKIKIDSLEYLKCLFTSKILVSNAGMIHGIDFVDDRIIKVETWHGSVLKKSGGEENQNSIGGKRKFSRLDNKTIRCAQNYLDIDIFSRIFHSDKSCFIKCGLPRNDELVNINNFDCFKKKKQLGISEDKKVILYMPTWREYMLDDKNDVVCKPPIDLNFWKEKLGNSFVLLFRAHYAVTAALNITDNEFVKDVSNYPFVNDLYLVSDILVSDYSSSIFDYSILERPIFCFAYDLEIYKAKRGLYFDLKEEMPLGIQGTEDELISAIMNYDENKTRVLMHKFRKKYATFVHGNASKVIVDKIIERM